jgi:hypothetical protein
VERRKEKSVVVCLIIWRFGTERDKERIGGEMLSPI